MTTQRLTRNILVFTAALALSACGDDGSGSGSASGTDSATGGATDGTATGGATATAGGTAGTSQGTASATGGSGSTGGSGGSGGSAGTGGTSGGTAGTSGGTAGTSGGTAGTGGGSTGGMSGGTGGTTGGVMACPLAEMQLSCDDQDNDPFHAIGLGCDSLGGNWNSMNSVTIADESMNAAPGNPLQGKPWQVGTMFGNATYGPQEGEKVLVISSGLIPDSMGGVITEDSSDDDVDFTPNNPWDSDSLPPPAIPVDGDTNPDPMVIDCNLMGDCTNTIQTQWELGFSDPNDKMWFEFDVTAPSLNDGDVADANGYKFDFAFLSEEFPEWVDSQYNDMFIVWQASSMFTGNVVFINDQPITVTALWDNATGVDYIGECPTGDPPVIPGCNGMATQLEGTDLTDDGAGTGWYTATGGVEPGETFKLMFMIMDMGDSALNSYAVIDNWRWDCEGCVPSEVNDCGIAPQ